MKKEIVIESCYSLLRNVTPLQFDCGKICNGKCCKGDDKTGMILFPGEKSIVDSSINIKSDDDGNELAICNGSCNRNYRPLSCRIYPLFPIIKNENGTQSIEVVLDPRADCPLVSGEYRFTPEFLKAVKRVGKYLLTNDETAGVYRNLSSEIEEIYNLRELLFK